MFLATPAMMEKTTTTTFLATEPRSPEESVCAFFVFGFPTIQCFNSSGCVLQLIRAFLIDW